MGVGEEDGVEWLGRGREVGAGEGVGGGRVRGGQGWGWEASKRSGRS